MLQRLEAKRDPQKNKQWVSDRLQTLKYLSNISAYPVQFIKQRKEIESHRKKKKPVLKDATLEQDRIEKAKKATQPLPAIQSKKKIQSKN